MARPTQHDVTQVALKTNEGNPTKLGVFQSLDVRAAPPKSAQLAQGLSEALGASMPFLQQYAEKKGEEAARKGINDEMLGQTNIKDTKRSDAYAMGVESVRARKEVTMAQQAWLEHSETLDKTMTAQEIAAEYDHFMKQRMGALVAENPRLAAKVAPAYMDGLQKAVIDQQAMVMKQHLDDADANMDMAVQDAAANKRPVDIVGLVQDRIALTGDVEGSWTRAVDTLGRNAVITGDETLLDQLPLNLTNEEGEELPNAAITTEMRARIDQYRIASHAKFLENQKVDRARFKMFQEWDWHDRIRNGIWIPETEFAEMLEKDGLWTEAELTAFRNAQYQAQQDQGDQFLWNDGLSKDAPYYTQVGMTDANGKVITQERAQRQTNRDVEARLAAITEANPDMPKELALATAAAQVSANEAYPYEPLKSIFDNVPLTDPQAFANAAEAFRKLPPSMRGTHVPDVKRRVLFERYLRKVDVLGQQGAHRVIEEMANTDPDVFDRNLDVYRKETRESQKKIPGLYLRDTTLPWQENDVQVSELLDREYAERWISEGIELRVGMGEDAEGAREMALQDFLTTHMLIESDSGIRTMQRIPGTTTALGEGIDWIETQLPTIGKKRGIDIPKGSFLRYNYASRDNASFVVVKPGGEQIAGLFFLPQVIETEYKRLHPKGNWRQIGQESIDNQERIKFIQDYRKAHPLEPTHRR